MSEQATTMSLPAKTPWHVWLVGILVLLWNGSGAVTIVLAQLGKLPDIKPDEAEYYAAQPWWFVLVTDISLVTALAAGVAVLMKKRIAALLFGVSLAAIITTNLYDVATGTSRAFANTGAFVVTVIIVVLAILQLLYADRMARRGILG